MYGLVDGTDLERIAQGIKSKYLDSSELSFLIIFFFSCDVNVSALRTKDILYTRY